MSDFARTGHDHGPEDDDDLLASEYVLGVLPLEARRAAAQRAEVDGAFAARIALWERRLAPLDAGFAPVEPAPGTFAAIEARLFPAPRPRAAVRGGWRLWVPTGLVVAALAGVAVMNPQALRLPWASAPAVASLSARLVAEGVIWQARFDGARLTVTREGAAAGAGADYQLWVIADDGVPRSLGVMPAEVLAVDSPLVQAGVTLAVSLEPAGGAPGALPTGPVLAAAPLAEG